MLVVSPFAVHHLPSLWGDDVDEFKPERFLAGGIDGESGDGGTMKFMPFITGPRSCIGARFAQMEMQVLSKCC